MIPGLPTGALDAAAAAFAAPLQALEKLASAIKSLVSLDEVAEALKSLGAAAVTVVPLFGVVGDKLQQLGELVKVTFRDNIGIPITNTLNAIGRGLKYALPTDVIDWFQKSLGAVSRAVGGVGRAAGGIAVGITAAVGVIAAAGYAMGQAVQKANPAVYEQFSLAVNDLIAVIGQALMPVFRLVTDVIRTFADTLVTFVAPIGEAVGTVLRPFVEVLKVVFEVFGRIGQVVADAVQAIAPALAGIGQAFLAVVQALMPGINLLIDIIGGILGLAMQNLGAILEAITPIITALARAFGDLIAWAARTVREILAFVGIDLPDRAGTRPGASVGAATRQAQISDVSSVIQQAQRSAFTLGAASGDPATRTASAAEELLKRANLIYDKIVSLPKDIADALNPFASRSDGRPTTSSVVTAAALSPITGLGPLTSALTPKSPDPNTSAREWFARRGRGDGGGTVAPAP